MGLVRTWRDVEKANPYYTINSESWQFGDRDTMGQMQDELQGFQPRHVFELAVAPAAAVAGRCRRRIAARAWLQRLLAVGPGDHPWSFRSRARPPRPDRGAAVRQRRRRQAFDDRFPGRLPRRPGRRANGWDAPTPASCSRSTGSPPRPAPRVPLGKSKQLEAITVRHTANEAGARLSRRRDAQAAEAGVCVDAAGGDRGRGASRARATSCSRMSTHVRVRAFGRCDADRSGAGR